MNGKGHAFLFLIFLLLGFVEVRGELEDTNVVAAAVSDEEAGWESVFTEENQIPFHINLYMKDGLYYEVMETSEYQGAFYTSLFSEKRRFTGRLGMKLHLDGALYSQNGSLPPADNSIAFRRFRVNTFGRGYLFTPITYGLEFGLSDGKFFFNSGYLWFHDVPYVKGVRMGVFTSPMSMSALQSSSATPLMELAAPVSAFTPGDLLGIQVGGGIFEQKGTLHAGWFADAVDNENRESSQSYSRLIARATWLPVDNESVGTLVHLGASGSHMFSTGDGVQFRSRPESFLAPFMIDTGQLAGERAVVYGIEAAWQQNDLFVQTEWLQSYADDQDNVMHRFGGAYATVGWVLTGEQRKYNRNGGFFSRITPQSDFSFKEGSWGAWELSGRFSYTDLNDENIQGGEMAVAMAGVNVYLSERSRLMLNGGYADISGKPDDGSLIMVQSRIQVDL